MKRTVLADGVDYEGEDPESPSLMAIVTLASPLAVVFVATFAWGGGFDRVMAACVLLAGIFSAVLSRWQRDAPLLSIRHHTLIVSGLPIPLAEVSGVQARLGTLEIQVGEATHVFPAYSEAMYADVLEAVARTRLNQEGAVDRAPELAKVRGLRTPQ